MSPHARLLDNPFFVLGLGPECSRAEVERAGQKILGMLELGLAGGDRYPTPFGMGRRDPAKVREAMSELRDPQRRLYHELWIAGATQGATTQGAPAGCFDDTLDTDLDPDLDPDLAPSVDDLDDGDRDAGFDAAPHALGWRR